MSRPCTPPGVDSDVFAALPADIQVELCREAASDAIAVSGSAGEPTTVPAPTVAADARFPLTFLTYNVWFRNLALKQRIQAVMEIVEETKPTFLGLQEVIATMLPVLRPRLEALGYFIYLQDRVTDFYGVALCSRVPLQGVTHLPFRNTVMGRELLYGRATWLLPTGTQCTFIVGTAHLESVAEAKVRREAERRQQAEIVFATLDEAVRKASASGAVFAGDVNWTDPVPRGSTWDGEYPLAPGWRDVFLSCQETNRHTGSAQRDGFTYDSVSNPMLCGKLRYRSDRVFVRDGDGFTALPEWVRLVGTTPISGLTYASTNPYNGVVKTLPVLPSDHFGVLVSLSVKAGKKRENAGSVATVGPAFAQGDGGKKRKLEAASSPSSEVVTLDDSDE